MAVLIYEIKKKYPRYLGRLFIAALTAGFLLVNAGMSKAQDSPRTAGGDPQSAMTLLQTVEEAIRANLSMKKSRQEIEAARNNQKVQRSNFLPTLNATYQVVRNDKAASIGGFTGGFTTLRDQNSLTTGFKQPIFTGFALVNQYKIAGLGLDVAELSQILTRLDVIFEAKRVYFNILKAQKLVEVALDSVKLLEAQVDVARNFYEVGMTPLNDLLQTQVELANTKQDLIVARNNLSVAESEFNVALRRNVNAPVRLTDIQTYKTLEENVDFYLKLAEKNRLEVKVDNLQIQIAEKELKISRKDFYPTVSLEGFYFKRGSNWDLSSESDEFVDPDGWAVTGIATWDFWQWGKTAFGERERRNRLSQARINREQTLDRIRIEVEQSFLKVNESDKNTVTVEKAIQQAEENMRITEERYKEQAATSTDILIAQNLLNRTRTNYFNSLYDFKIAKAFLQRAIGLEIME